MPRRGGLGLGASSRGSGRRRTVLQLDEQRREPTFGFGYNPAQQDVPPEPVPQKVNNNLGGLGGLLSTYGESDSEEESPEPPPKVEKVKPILKIRGRGKYQKVNFVAAKAPSETNSEESSPAPPPQKDNSASNQVASEAKSGTKDEIDAKVFDFLAEINADDEKEDSASVEKPVTDAVNGKDAENEASDIKETEANQTKEESEEEEDLGPEPEAPTTVWQHCLDEATQCYYYWNYETNAVTWEIPTDYSQYLLLQKEYEEMLAKYQSRKEALEKKLKNKPEKKKKVKTKENVPIPDDTGPDQSPPTKPADDNSTTTSGGISLVPYEETPETIKTKSCREIGPQLQTDYSDFVQGETISEGQQSLVTSEKDILPPDDGVSMETHSEAQQSPGDRENSDEIKPVVKSESDELDNACDKNDEDYATSILENLEKEFVKRSASPESVKEDHIDDKEVSVNGDIDEEEFDIDDIDQQLDLALERKMKTSSYAENVPDSSKDRKRPPGKVEENGHGLDEPINKKAKKDTDISNATDSNVPIETCNLITTEQVTDLSTLLTDKLEFLDVSRKGLSKLQILLIEIETRIGDWKEGVLNTEYLMKKLNEANLCLEQYESSAAPTGWSCHFDRSYKRYFYSNYVTGETQWDYPEPDVTGGAQAAESLPSLADAIKQPPPPPPPPEDPEDSEVKPQPDPSILPVSSRTEAEVTVELGEIKEETNAPEAIENEQTTDAGKPPAPPAQDEPPPPGTGPPLPPDRGISLASLAAAPPPPPPPEEEPTPAPLMCYDVSQPIHPIETMYTPYDGAETYDADTCIVPENSKGSAHISAPPVIKRPAVSDPIELPVPVEMKETVTPAPVAEVAAPVDMEDKVPEMSQAPVTAAAAPPSTSSHPSSSSSSTKKKKKDKDKALLGSGLSLKKKKLPSLVQKWQKVQEEAD